MLDNVQLKLVAIGAITSLESICKEVIPVIDVAEEQSTSGIKEKRMQELNRKCIVFRCCSYHNSYSPPFHRLSLPFKSQIALDGVFAFTLNGFSCLFSLFI